MPCGGYEACVTHEGNNMQEVCNRGGVGVGCQYKCVLIVVPQLGTKILIPMAFFGLSGLFLFGPDFKV